MRSLDKSREETFAAKVRVDDFITGIWIISSILQSETFFFVYDGQSPKAISNTPLQRLPRQKKVHQSMTRRLVFRVPCLSHYRRYLQSWVVCLSRFPRDFSHTASIRNVCMWELWRLCTALINNLTWVRAHRHKKCFLFKFLTSGDHRARSN